MPLALVRIDDRLIHGQVVEGWLPALGVSRVIVVSDSAAEDDLQKGLMRLALPEGIALEVMGSAEAGPAVKEAARSEEKVMILAPGPAEILALCRAGVPLGCVNVGGLHHAAGRIRIGRAIFLSDEDQGALEEIAQAGVRLEGRSVPAEPPEDLSGFMGGRK
jgi:mannose/fructose/N-acetylgalactosamine-specific phosphotransferase system component IIB